MWLSRKNTSDPRWDEKYAETGSVTISSPLSVMLDSEARELPIASPGGYLWRPKVGQSLLVIKCGDDDHIAVAAENALPDSLEEGEVRIISEGGAQIDLRRDGTLKISGNTKIEGSLEIIGSLKLSGDLNVSGVTRVGDLYINGVKYHPPTPA